MKRLGSWLNLAFYSLMVRLHSVFTALAVLIITASIVHAQYWNPANVGLALPVKSLAINGAGDMFGAVPDMGLYRSKDLGLSWTLLPNPNGYTLDHVWCINGLGHIFAVAGWQEFRSTNNGDSWTPIRIQPPMS